VRQLREIYEVGTHDLAYSSGNAIIAERARGKNILASSYQAMIITMCEAADRVL
jgi:hypothetical protein